MERVSSYRYLGVKITEDLSWSTHVNKITQKARKHIGLLYHQFCVWSIPEALLQLSTLGSVKTFYHSFLPSTMELIPTVRCNCPHIEFIQESAFKLLSASLVCSVKLLLLLCVCVCVCVFFLFSFPIIVGLSYFNILFIYFGYVPVFIVLCTDVLFHAYA